MYVYINFTVTLRRAARFVQCASKLPRVNCPTRASRKLRPEANENENENETCLTNALLHLKLHLTTNFGGNLCQLERNRLLMLEINSLHLSFPCLAHMYNNPIEKRHYKRRW